MTTTAAMKKYLRDITRRRNAILVAFTQAYLAAVVPDDKLDPAWIAGNVEFVQRMSEDGREVKWFFRLRTVDLEV